MIGESIGNFRIVSQLGAGGMGDVFLAEHREMHTKVAVKLLHANISSDQTQIRRFFGEAVAVSTIKHAGIVRIFDSGFTDAGRAYLVMEFLEGETLSSRIRKAGRLAIADVADIGRQAAGVLAATHAEGIVHRDLKPDNIYLVRDAEMARGERVKILDFGIAKLANTNLTGSANSMGTPTYMAPEQWNHSGGVDWRADVYSLGCLAFEMVCGRPPFVPTSIGEACAMHLNDAPPPARTFAPECPPALEELLARMLAKAPDDRPASMAEIAAGFSAHADSPTGPMYAVGAPTGVALAATLATGAGSRVIASRIEPGFAPGTVSGTAVTPPPRRHRGLLLGGLGVVLVGGAAAAVFALASHGKEPPKHEAKAATRDGGVVAAADAQVAVAPPPSTGRPPIMANAWVAIPLPPHPIALGVDADSAPDSERGFRPARKIMSPTAPYAIQAHEVTWSELDPYLAARGEPILFPAWAQDRTKRARLPATNVTWQMAHEYCASIRGELPTEEEWELAARGAERRPNAWGADKLDRMLTHTLVGEGGTPDEAMKSEQDKTPVQGAGDARVFDLIGNVQEWTEGLWREDKAGADESWVEDGDTTYRALRGLPLHGAATTKVQVDAAAYREPACATGDCKGKYVPPLDAVGFRCVQNDKTRVATAAPAPPRPRLDAGVAVAPAPAAVDAGVAVDCTLESCQDNGMGGACCARKFPKKPAPPPSALPEKPTPETVKAVFAALLPKVKECAARTGAYGSHKVTLTAGPTGHISEVKVVAMQGSFRECVSAAAHALTLLPSRDGAVVSTFFHLGADPRGQ